MDRAPATALGRPPRIALVAGETSGDRLGAGLIRALAARAPGARFAGIGGEAMRAAGLEAWFDCSELAVMGLFEVLGELPRLLRLRARLLARLAAWAPDLYVGIDAPDFNLGIERRLRRAGVHTAHYVSPAVWAWRPGRIARVGAAAELVLCLFPMEPPLYAARGHRALFVGHPLAAALPPVPDRAAARHALGLAEEATVVAVLPGSRRGEIRRLARPFLAALAELARGRPGMVALLPLARPEARAWLEPALAAVDPGCELRLLPGRALEAMTAADAVLLASGTAALEAMLCQRPMVVGYRIHPLSHLLVRALGLLRSPFVSLPNLLAGERLVPELLQGECRPAALARALGEQLAADPAPLAARFRELHERLRGPGEEAAAEALLGLLA